MAKQKTSKYLFTSSSASGMLIITYKKGSFQKLERKSGTFTQTQWERLTSIIPMSDEDIMSIKIPNIEFSKFQEIPKSENLYKRFNDIYFEFHRERLGVDPKFNAAEGKALKEIIKYLESQIKDENEVVAVWESLLSNWNSLTTYYQGKIRLVEINSNLVNIINCIKNGEHSEKAGDNIADDVRRKYQNRPNS